MKNRLLIQVKRTTSSILNNYMLYSIQLPLLFLNKIDKRVYILFYMHSYMIICIHAFKI